MKVLEKDEGQENVRKKVRAQRMKLNVGIRV